MKLFCNLKTFLILFLSIIATLTFYFYDQFDTRVTESCQAGALTMRDYLGKRGPSGIDDVLFRCSSNSIVFKYNCINPKLSVDEISCASGMGIALDKYDPEHEWDVYHHIFRRPELVYELLGDCKRRIKKIHENTVASK